MYYLLKELDFLYYHIAHLYFRCFLNPYNHFKWSLIVPVIFIFLINTGFFIMAATIMWRHQKKQTEKSKFQNMSSWLKSAISLVVIMGITWALGLVIIERQELLPLTYIYTTMVAFQGVIIFLIYVVFSKTVREAYSKWWNVKVNSSDFLSKHFERRSLNSSSVSMLTIIHKELDYDL